ncbi:hypothetical protein NQP46_27210 [Streptomyces albus]|nr:hypothetical protein NQP46_27210 [Streptomyces albus]
MLRFEVSVDDLMRSRFALSPAMDLCFLLRSLAGRDQPLPRAWADRLRPAFERLRRETELNAFLALHTPDPDRTSSPRPRAASTRPGRTTWSRSGPRLWKRPATRSPPPRPAHPPVIPAYAPCWTRRTPSPGSPRRWIWPGTSCSPRTGRNCARSASATSCTGWG